MMATSGPTRESGSGLVLPAPGEGGDLMMATSGPTRDLPAACGAQGSNRLMPSQTVGRGGVACGAQRSNHVCLARTIHGTGWWRSRTARR